MHSIMQSLLKQLLFMLPKLLLLLTPMVTPQTLQMISLSLDADEVSPASANDKAAIIPAFLDNLMEPVTQSHEVDIGLDDDAAIESFLGSLEDALLPSEPLQQQPVIPLVVHALQFHTCASPLRNLTGLLPLPNNLGGTSISLPLDYLTGNASYVTAPAALAEDAHDDVDTTYKPLLALNDQ
ncbi:hypothetical protein GOP47_0014050 [Adiantum capillus-veneris]|uniref:Uncharacterized protein n=1 Tax=Adiantum capillus-veneris TaxID=13818 RepID=A0A9D4ZDY8_ADICA|nr:hypothetical protein GOP47_0014050 [Adiantum capillus-veneris]